jgi:hypothetical protein
MTAPAGNKFKWLTDYISDIFVVIMIQEGVDWRKGFQSKYPLHQVEHAREVGPQDQQALDYTHIIDQREGDRDSQ